MSAGRFAPSPTGELHFGNLRTAMLSWLFARSEHSTYLVRMEDLDPDSTRAGSAEQQLSDLSALGIEWDGDVVFQSDRLHLYRAAINRLTGAGLTYPCYCSRREIREAAAAPHEGPTPDGAYPGTCRHLTEAERANRESQGRPGALRIRTDAAPVEFVDRVCGAFTGHVDDVVIRRGNGVPAYNLAVVVDDAEQGVEEVVRGDDLLSSTPRQLHIADLLGLARPTYAHVPLVVNEAGDRLSKRDGSVTMSDLAAEGIDADAVRSMLAESLDIAEPGEPITAATMLGRFDPDAVSTQPVVFTADTLASWGNP